MPDLLKQLGSINWVVSLISGLVLSVLGRLLANYAEKWLARLSTQWTARRRKNLEL
jgi:hypothetical protein